MTSTPSNEALDGGAPLGYQAMPSPASSATLDEVVLRLASHPDVEGAALVGSGADSLMTAASDIDLLIVVEEKWAILRTGVTWIEGRMGDLLFVTRNEVDAIACTEPLSGADAWVGRVARFLACGRILVDSDGRLAKAQKAARQLPEMASGPTRGDAYRAWHKINYDRQHNRRMLTSDDADYATALDLRLLYGLDDVFTGYFAIRYVRWEGQKAAIRYLRERDPAFLELFKRCLAEQDWDAKFALYEQLCQEATTPAGGLWPEEPTGAHLREPESATPETHAASTTFVQSLVRGD